MILVQIQSKKKKKRERERILKWLVLSYILERTFNFLF